MADPILPVAADPGLTPQLAHNALAAVVEMYRAALDQAARRERSLVATVLKLSAELEVLKKDAPPDASRAPTRREPPP